MVLVSSEFFKVKKKRLSLNEEYIKVLVIAQDLRKTIDELNIGAKQAKVNSENNIQEFEAKFEKLSKNVDTLEARITKAEAQVRKTR